MSELISAALGVLNGFRSEVSTWTNQGLLTSIDGHIAQIKNAATQDVHAGETAVKQVMAELYGAFHGHTTEPAAPVPAEGPTASSSASTAPATPSAAPSSTPTTTAAEPAPVAADPTPAPSTTTEASSAPSSTASTTTTEPPAASA